MHCRLHRLPTKVLQKWDADHGDLLACMVPFQPTPRYRNPLSCESGQTNADNRKPCAIGRRTVLRSQ